MYPQLRRMGLRWWRRAGIVDGQHGANGAAGQAGASAGQDYSTVSGTNTGIVVTTLALPTPQPGIAYRATLVASGGSGSYTWSVVQGSLPDGLTLDPSGVISGTPLNTDPNYVTLKIKDASGPLFATTAYVLDQKTQRQAFLPASFGGKSAP